MRFAWTIGVGTSLALALGMARPGDPTPVHLIIMAGQSNCAGMCANNVPVIYRDTPANVKYCENYDNGLVVTEWGPLTPRTEPGENPKWGAEYTLAHTLAARGGEWRIAKVSKGGSRLYFGPGSDPDFSWNVGEGTLYQTLYDFITERTGDLADQNCTITDVTLLWIQGESDATSQEKADDYEINLLGLIAYASYDFGVSHVVVVKGYPQAPNFDWMPEVRAAMDAVDANDPDVVAISAEGLPVKPLPDGRHYTKAGYLELGEMLAQEVP